MNKVTLENVFNTNLTAFIKDLLIIYPEEYMFKKALAAIDAAVILDRSRPLLQYMEYCAPYEQYIISKNEQFFLEQNIKQSHNVSEKTMNIIQNIKDMWSQMNNNNKEMIWKWIILLYRIGQKYIHIV